MCFFFEVAREHVGRLGHTGICAAQCACVCLTVRRRRSGSTYPSCGETSFHHDRASSLDVSASRCLSLVPPRGHEVRGLFVPPYSKLILRRLHEIAGVLVGRHRVLYTDATMHDVVGARSPGRQHASKVCVTASTYGRPLARASRTMDLQRVSEHAIWTAATLLLPATCCMHGCSTEWQAPPPTCPRHAGYASA
ncbi:hypothetical protein OH76DRAFT_94385 [Lentinus brumalis]|uniref:Uncharacterized protein n=1 Tax=Lentinus brumalis TaxID=2498619 RepID=A0A371CQS8_9APHY|nr:hypothetical protein OH76DRAFT_94385 [Polyporus brumalis]